MLENIDSNPHAEIAPPVPAPDWRTNPHEFVSWARDFGDGFEALAAPFLAVVESDRQAFEESNGAAAGALRVARAIASIYRQSYAFPRAHDFVRVGEFRFPPTPTGIAALRVLREWAPGIVRGVVSGFAEADSDFAKVAAALEDTNGRGIVANITNATVATSDAGANPARYTQFAIGVHLRPDVAAALPTVEGSRIRSVLAVELDGYDFDGDEIEKWREDVGACFSGTVEFLERLGVSHETNGGGSYDCESCGAERGDDDEGDEIESCADFVIDAKAIRMLDSAGYLEKTQKWIAGRGDSGGSDSWEEFIAEHSCAEAVAQFGPTVASPVGETVGAVVGAAFDRAAWTFEPDIAGMIDAGESIDDGPTLVSLARTLGAISDAHTAVGSLPPVDGTLTYTRGGAVTLEWNAEHGTLRTALGRVASLVLDVENGSRRVDLNLDTGRVSRYVLESDGTRIMLPRDSAGATAGDYLALACADVAL